MNRPLIAKLLTPRTNRTVRRPRVFRAIDAALQSGNCWIAAPAGYGKTTALADYLRTRPAAHVWYRVDEGDQDIASFFHYLARSLPAKGTRALPVFGPEYADQPQAFARRFFRDYFSRLPDGTRLVLDDLHNADVPQFAAVLEVLLKELPESLRCVCLSRTLPPHALDDFVLRGQLAVVDQAVLEFSEPEARALVTARLRRAAAAVDVSAALR